jgi:pimeloyl-ACP methyl ester carboxylesterase
MPNPHVAYGADVLPEGIRSRFVTGVRGLDMHVLEAGVPGHPVVILLHGFPELAFSWRKLMLPLAAAGYHVIAPDQRGYGRTTGWDDRYDTDLAPFRYLALVEDVVVLLERLGLDAVAIVGHDFGSPVAAWAALTRPDLFRSVALMSAPFPGAPAALVPGSATEGVAEPSSRPDMQAALAALPRPRKHYMWHYATREAGPRMHAPPQGLHRFLRAYYHVKSADWPGNDPHPLAGWTAAALAELPTYYVMDLDRDMPGTVAPDMPTDAEVAACTWLTEPELAVYAAEYARTGFQGGLNWYRCAIDPDATAELRAWAGHRIDVPACFIGGRKDWGVYQSSGAVERMARDACADWRGTHLLERAGHWVQQEQAQTTLQRLLAFLDAVQPAR